MASRCVVEMGTASYYTTLSRASPEPVLSLLTRRIVETIGQQPGIGQTVGVNVVKVGEQVLTDH